MANPWYTNTFSGQAGQIARAEQCNIQFGLINTAFDTIYASADPTSGTSTVRMLRAPVGETVTQMAAAASRANKFIQFDATGLIPQMVSGSPSVPTPAGSTLEFQYNLAGVLAATTGLQWGNAANSIYYGVATGTGGNTFIKNEQTVNATGSNGFAGFYLNNDITGAAVGSVYGFYSRATFLGAATTYIGHYSQATVTIGSLTNAYGYYHLGSNATNNYGFYTSQSAGATSWSFYAAGAARSKFGSHGVVLDPLTTASEPTTLTDGALWYSTYSSIDEGFCGRYNGVSYNISGLPRYTSALTASASLTAGNSGWTFTNTGASGDVVFDVPASADIGVYYDFAVVAAHYIKVKANGSDVIYNAASVSAAAGYIRSTTVGHTVRVKKVASGKWMVTALTGTWTVDS